MERESMDNGVRPHMGGCEEGSQERDANKKMA